jgi:hypothetical protein
MLTPSIAWLLTAVVLVAGGFLFRRWRNDRERAFILDLQRRGAVVGGSEDVCMGIDFRGIHVTDDDLRFLRNCRQIDHLCFERMPIRDDELKRLHPLKRLAILNLDGTQVSDLGLARLRSMRGLGLLSLRDTRVTDAGVLQLRSLTKLKILHLAGTDVTDTGVADLQEALPNCKIIVDGG